MNDAPTPLEPCPFCGGAAKYDEREDGAVYVCCIKCDAATSAYLSLKDSGADQARNAWNGRAPKPTPADLPPLSKEARDARRPVPPGIALDTLHGAVHETATPAEPTPARERALELIRQMEVHAGAIGQHAASAFQLHTRSLCLSWALEVRALLTPEPGEPE